VHGAATDGARPPISHGCTYANCQVLVERIQRGTCWAKQQDSQQDGDEAQLLIESMVLKEGGVEAQDNGPLSRETMRCTEILGTGRRVVKMRVAPRLLACVSIGGNWLGK
jgi:hypothetical protein